MANISDMELPIADRASFVSKELDFDHIYDPPPFVWRVLEEPVLVRVLGAKLKYQAEIAKLEGRILDVRAQMFSEISKIIQT